jgi:transposase
MASNIDKETNKWILVCNASIHKEKSPIAQTKDYINLLYLPPYSPQLNPIESFFADIKREISKRQYTFITDLVYNIHYTIMSYNAKKLKKHVS